MTLHSSQDSQPRAAGRRGVQHVLNVLERVQLSPRMVRIKVGGGDIQKIENNGKTDAYTKMLFAHPDTQLTPPYDLDKLRAELAPEQMPSRRTYTIRRFDVENECLWIDFVVHGDEGIAGPWADRAQPGDVVVLGGIGGGYAPDVEADWHLLAGDDAALPAIASAFEAMPAAAQGVAFIEVDDEADQLTLSPSRSGWSATICSLCDASSRPRSARSTCCCATRLAARSPSRSSAAATLTGSSSSPGTSNCSTAIRT